jgi:hypothetical protein
MAIHTYYETITSPPTLASFENYRYIIVESDASYYVSTGVL